MAFKAETEGNICLPLKEPYGEGRLKRMQLCFSVMEVAHPKPIRNPNPRMLQPYKNDAAFGHNLCIAALMLGMISTYPIGMNTL